MTDAALSADTGLAGVAEQFPILGREFEDRPPLCYLNTAATSQKPAIVLDALDDFYRFHNSSIHRGVDALTQEATDRYEQARRSVARWLGGVALREVIFTRNVTEAINLVAYSWGRHHVGAGDRVLITEMEHHSNIVPWQILCQERGAKLEYVPIDGDGRLDLDALDERLSHEPKLLGVAHVSNVLGTINPIAEIVRRAKAVGASVLVDGAQAAPHLPLDVRAIGADFYGFTGHKVYGPGGVGVLYGRRELLEEMPPFLTGGDMIRTVDLLESRWNDLPWKFEAGTSAYAEASALGVAIEWLGELGIERVRDHEADLTGYALECLPELPGLRLYGPPAPDHGAAVSFALQGAHPHDVAEVLARDNVCIRAGHHCAQPLMRRLGVPATSRASFGVYNTRADVDRLVDGLHRVRDVLRLD